MKITKRRFKRIVKEAYDSEIMQTHSRTQVQPQSEIGYLVDEVAEIWSLLPKKAFWAVLKKALRNPGSAIALGKHYTQEVNYTSLLEYLKNNNSFMTPLSMKRLQVMDNEEELIYTMLDLVNENADEIIELLVSHYNQSTGKNLQLEHVLTDKMLAERNKRHLRKIIREVMDTEVFQPLKSFTLPYQGTGYGGRRIISRDKAWLEFVPLGAPSTTQEDMFRAVVLLDNDDPEISKALQRGGPKSMGPIQSYDVYSVYATTTG